MRGFNCDNSILIFLFTFKVFHRSYLVENLVCVLLNSLTQILNCCDPQHSEALDS
jgi:hypothetical protein